MDKLDRAIAIAVEAHAGQVDKTGEPYILHPLRVMLDVPPDCREAAVLHDVAEDCPDWPLERLAAEGFDPIVLSAIGALTRQGGESYSDFIRRCGANSIARVVKKADLRDNMDERRLKHVPEPDRSRLHKKYFHAFGELL